jgi:hypothetical protein
MRKITEDRIKSPAQLMKEMGRTCKVDGCKNPLTHMQGPGSGALCREHQIEQREYGGMGRLDRPHTFHRNWICEECGYNALQDPRLAAVGDEMTKRRIARTLMHGDHNGKRKSEGGDDSAANIKSLCFVCHAVKTTVEEDYMPPPKTI